MLTKKLRLMTLCMVLMLLTTSVAGAAPMTSNTTTMPKSVSTGAYAANEVMEGYSPLTGEPYSGEYKPVLVQISNAKEARPHINMSEADIVYEMVYWGPRHTRYTAVYNDNHPSIVASVRSARTMHVQLRQEWDAPFVFWGGQQDEGTNIYDFFKQYNANSKLLFDGVGKVKDGGAKQPLFRMEGRVNPHDAAVNLETLVNEYWPEIDGAPYEPKMHAFKFSDPPSYGADSAYEIYIPYDEKEYFPSYKFNTSDRVYERSYNGEEQFDGQTSKRIVASNVIVQYADLSFYNNTASRAVITFVGSGPCDIFLNGRHIRGSWERTGINDRTVFTDMNGEEITLLPGKTFIQVVPMDMAYTYIRDDGSEITVESGTDVKFMTQIDEDESIEDINKVEEGVV